MRGWTGIQRLDRSRLLHARGIPLIAVIAAAQPSDSVITMVLHVKKYMHLGMLKFSCTLSCASHAFPMTFTYAMCRWMRFSSENLLCKSQSALPVKKACHSML